MGVIGGSRFLVVRLGAIGDCLRTLPAVRRLRQERPTARIGWCVEHGVVPVLEGNPDVDRFHVLERRALRAGPTAALTEARRLTRELRDERYDVALDFHGRFKSGVVSLLSGARCRIGYARGDSTELNHLFTNVHVKLEDRWENRVLRFLHLLAPLGIRTHFDASETGLYVAPVMRRQAEQWYTEIGAPTLAVYPGSSRRRARDRWPADKWSELLARLGRTGVASVVFWGPEEAELVQAIAAKAGQSCRFAPATTLPEMMAMIGCFRAFIGSDTAAMHMAWLQGVATAVFTSPKPVRTFAPLDPIPHRVLRADRYVVPGVRASRQPREVVTAVSVDEAFAAVQSLLQSDGS